MTFSLTVLGSSSALPTKDRFPTAHVLNVHERFFLVDCGEGTQMQLRKAAGSAKLSRLNHIFISHLHGDHFFGLFGLISTMDLMGRNNHLHIYGPPTLDEMLKDHLKYFGQNMGYQIITHVVDTTANTVVYEDHCMTVETIPLKHRVPCCGYLFKEKTPAKNIFKDAISKYNLSIADIARIKEGNDFITAEGEVIPHGELTYTPFIPRSYAFCSDTQFSERVAEIVKGVDLLYHEATFLDDMKDMAKQTVHSTAKQAGSIARMAGVKELLIGHFSSRYDDKLLPNFEREARTEFPESYVVEEGKTYDVPLEKYGSAL